MTVGVRQEKSQRIKHQIGVFLLYERKKAVQ